MKIKRTRQADGPRLRLRRSHELEAFDARLPGESGALVEAQRIVADGQALGVLVLDIDADDVLYTVIREEKSVVTYTGAHGTPAPRTEAQGGVEASI